GAVQIGQSEVQDDHVESEMGDLAQRLQRRPDTAHEVCGVGQVPDQRRAYELVVLDHENTCHGRHRTPCGWARWGPVDNSGTVHRRDTRGAGEAVWADDAQRTRTRTGLAAR